MFGTAVVGNPAGLNAVRTLVSLRTKLIPEIVAPDAIETTVPPAILVTPG
jgi:hypothetical protein